MPPATQPRHRRPSWRQSRVSHRTYLETDFNRKQNSDLPADADTFYYNPAFVAEWTMPADLWVRLPALLTTELRDWQAAGAAVCTALARIDRLDAESLHRGWPLKNNVHLSRTTSDCSAIDSPRSPNADSFEGPPLDASATFPLHHADFEDMLKGNFVSSMTSDTPPFTPRDSIMGDEVEIPNLSCHDKVSLEHINAVLATKGRRASESTAATGGPSTTTTPMSRSASHESLDNVPTQFDEAAWDVFIRSYEAELEHLRTETFVRFRHIGKSVDRLWLDLKSDGMQPMLNAASIEFLAWWQKMNDKAQEYEKEVQMLEVPQLELVRLKRASQGLAS